MTTEKHEVLLRMKAIELLAYWEGRLVTNRLMEWFGISRQQASADIKRYMVNYNPHSLVHDPSVKAYVPKPSFQPVLTTGHINEYLDMVSGLVSGSMAITLETDIQLSSVQLPDRSVRPEVVREVIKACRASSSIKILYASMDNPAWSERVISPHTLVYTGFRWHVRAYCHKRNNYRDFILSRIDRTPKPSDTKAPTIDGDKHWNEVVPITLVPNTQLNDGQKILVEKDYAMPEGRLQLRVRKSLVHYTLQRYRAAITDEEIADTRQYHIQLAEQDRKILYPYLFGSNS
ncbi:MAG: hypothetical protein OFPII_05730 [Osedax symbiont Rs1]|nr:MAG: hypothetical protein OFPII_05730 [Osedax symbiont Rs1]